MNGTLRFILLLGGIVGGLSTELIDLINWTVYSLLPYARGDAGIVISEPNPNIIFYETPLLWIGTILGFAAFMIVIIDYALYLHKRPYL